MKRVVFNQKGGVGKSTITCNLAAVAAAQGRRTLVIDLDPQGNSTRYLLGDGADGLELTGSAFFEQMLSALEGYDEIWIDTPPALHFYTRSALIAADSCLIPFDCDDFARRALYALLDNVAEIRADHNAALRVEGIVVNQFQPRANLPLKIVQELRDEGLPVLNTLLSASIRIKESHQQATPMIHLDRRHKLALEFTALYQELVAAGKVPGTVPAKRSKGRSLNLPTPCQRCAFAWLETAPGPVRTPGAHVRERWPPPAHAGQNPMRQPPRWSASRRVWPSPP